ncbi:hypothetical protein PR048_007201 [Dryococelus australis]|uniref:Uncharacterized protein n=1 Tax=Dryococelus australis TaxID=614101 RepID=A0ABQ9ICZ5_9NEOP|nr:hypothetical protein PR048_007201 [Dryococelus australis]
MPLSPDSVQGGQKFRSIRTKIRWLDQFHQSGRRAVVGKLGALATLPFSNILSHRAYTKQAIAVANVNLQEKPVATHAASHNQNWRYWLTGFLWDLMFTSLLHSSAAPHPHCFTLIGSRDDLVSHPLAGKWRSASSHPVYVYIGYELWLIVGVSGLAYTDRIDPLWPRGLSSGDEIGYGLFRLIAGNCLRRDLNPDCLSGSSSVIVQKLGSTFVLWCRIRSILPDCRLARLDRLERLCVLVFVGGACIRVG